MSRQLNIRVPNEWMALLDELRGDMSRGEYVIGLVDGVAMGREPVMTPVGSAAADVTVIAIEANGLKLVDADNPHLLP